MKWTTKNGESIEVSDMYNEHVERVLLMLIKNNGPHKILEAVLYAKKICDEKEESKEVTLNGDMAQAFNDSYEENEYEVDPYID
jgi:hypothetical protein